jgi:hypothetical protein
MYVLKVVIEGGSSVTANNLITTGNPCILCATTTQDARIFSLKRRIANENYL